MEELTKISLFVVLLSNGISSAGNVWTSAAHWEEHMEFHGKQFVGNDAVSSACNLMVYTWILNYVCFTSFVCPSISGRKLNQWSTIVNGLIVAASLNLWIWLSLNKTVIFYLGLLIALSIFTNVFQLILLRRQLKKKLASSASNRYILKNSYRLRQNKRTLDFFCSVFCTQFPFMGIKLLGYVVTAAMPALGTFTICVGLIAHSCLLCVCMNALVTFAGHRDMQFQIYQLHERVARRNYNPDLAEWESGQGMQIEVATEATSYGTERF
ncbi:hypothetical protein L596_016960 [Steinernema carpocapsae]|uniref:Uncharacterized protein n=1 Tax=Steinernema carpocapsae TaxID=34508 RepID=A0A4U5MZU7_STECR|nr:hypothetical protein L596_016960 [Steinernema carpocapsae]